MTPEGINDEMRPYLRMTLPPGSSGSTPRASRSARRSAAAGSSSSACSPSTTTRSALARLEPGRGFLERSKMLSQRTWEHERTLEPAAGGGCLITDRVRWQPRLGLPGRPLRPIIAWFFRHRHKRLRQHFGGAAVGT